MENNKKENSPWDRIKKFFSQIFNKKALLIEGKKEECVEKIEKKENQFESVVKRDALAKKLLNTGIKVNQLSNEQIDEMIIYFKKDIEAQKQKLNALKNQIIKIKSK